MRRRFKIIVATLITLLFLSDYYLGTFERMFEKNFYTEFYYPYYVDAQRLFYQFEHNEAPYEAPINVYNYTLLTNCEHKCKSTNGLNLNLVVLVKSALANIQQRNVIRNTWGLEDRFPGVKIARVFLLGTSPDTKLMHDIKTESNNHKDIVQTDFVDSYFNNTIKTMTGFRWALSHCPSEFYMFADDDMYVSMKNVLSYLNDPINYPNSNSNLFKRDTRKILRSTYKVKEGSNYSKYHQNKWNKSIQKEVPLKLNKSEHIASYIKGGWNRQEIQKTDKFPINTVPKLIHTFKRKRRQIVNPFDNVFYGGHVDDARPIRDKSSKWYISLKEYPYNKWPLFTPAGSYVLSQKALRLMYYMSMYTKHFRFDDIFLGLVAFKAGIKLHHCEEFHNYKKPYDPAGYQYVIASHGYGDVDELLKVWNEQRILKNA